MPKKRITFIIIPPNDGQVQEYKFAPRILWIACLVAVTLVGCLGYYSYSYHTRVDQQALLTDLRQENAQLVTGLETARRELGDLEGSLARRVEPPPAEAWRAQELEHGLALQTADDRTGQVQAHPREGNP